MEVYMKNLLSLLLITFVLAIFTVGCSKEIVENKVETDKYIPEGLTNEIGKGDIVINTPTSTSEDGNIPVIYIDEYKGLVQLGFTSIDFDDSRPSYIYIDKKLNTIETLGKSDSINLTIYEENLNEGMHKVEVVQFDNNKTSGTPITYKSCNYKIDKR
jgi:hypothetical protein